MDKKKFYLFIPVLLVFVLGCSGTPPEIQGVVWQKLYRIKGNNSSFESLSFFVNVYDEDGEGDIDSIYLISDSQELFWKLTPENWVEKTVDSRLWAGSNSLKTPEGEPLPAGNYRVVVIDKGGGRKSKEIYISECDSKKPLPSMTVTDTKVSISSACRDNYLYLKDSGSNVLKIITVTPGDTSMELLTKDLKGSLKEITLYSCGSTGNCGYLLSVSVP